MITEIASHWKGSYGKGAHKGVHLISVHVLAEVSNYFKKKNLNPKATFQSYLKSQQHLAMLTIVVLKHYPFLAAILANPL